MQIFRKSEYKFFRAHPGAKPQSKREIIIIFNPIWKQFQSKANVLQSTNSNIPIVTSHQVDYSLITSRGGQKAIDPHLKIHTSNKNVPNTK